MRILAVALVAWPVILHAEGSPVAPPAGVRRIRRNVHRSLPSRKRKAA